MSDDLISRKETEKILRAYADDVGCNRGEYELANGILKAVCHLNKPELVPTAYDADKVIEQLEQQKNQYIRRSEEIKNKVGENYESQRLFQRPAVTNMR